LRDDSGKTLTETGFLARDFLEYQAHNLLPARPFCAAWLLVPDAMSSNITLIDGEQVPTKSLPGTLTPSGDWSVRIVQMPGSRIQKPTLLIREQPDIRATPWQTFQVQFYQREAAHASQ